MRKLISDLTDEWETGRRVLVGGISMCPSPTGIFGRTTVSAVPSDD